MQERVSGECRVGWGGMRWVGVEGSGMLSGSMVLAKPSPTSAVTGLSKVGTRKGTELSAGLVF